MSDHDEGCICKGNWRAIVNEYGPKIGRRFVDRHGDEYTFFGIVHSDDDYYYGMAKKDGTFLLCSCVGYLEGERGMGFTEIPNA
ncbi:MAG: hypothetical protein WC736_16530 [Gallionella sp.]|jgi:hypothetical protein